jgi:UDPglucose 6-dehydrogenase|tara:strand:+ start:54 stop:893 length:840 start_codon:yes stop_codon:yes gene_type:complete
MEIGIVGQGYVGTAIKVGFEPHYDYIHTYDKYDLAKSTLPNIKDLVDKCDVIFVCVPTPMRKDGTCYTGIVEEVIKEIDYNVDVNKDKPIVVIKSTIPPGTTDKFNKSYSNVIVIFNPEFLTEENFLEDFKNQKRIILGGQRNGTNTLRQIYSKVFPHATIVKTGSKTAEMVKYFINNFLATKVSFANEMYKVCEQVDIDYDKVVEYATYDERLGKSHWAVPGPDGDLGFGGHCLPKDLSAIINQFETYGLLEAVENVNDQVRDNRDWEEMKGRAIIDE